MTEAKDSTIRLHNEVYSYIHPTKYRNALPSKVAVITGAAGSIGQAHAESFAVAGCRLFLVYNKTPPPNELEVKCRQYGAADVSFIKCNVADPQECQNLIASIIEQAGRIDVLVNNAGANNLCATHIQPPDDFLYEMAVNFNGPYCLMRAVLPHMRSETQQKQGCIINIASRAGTVAIPWSTSYCASKAALIQLTGCIQKELDAEGFDGIHLYALHPGGVRSTMVNAKYSEDSIKSLPVDGVYKNILQYYNDSAHLSGMTSVALAAGVAKHVLRGRYYDVGQDLGDVLDKHGDEIAGSNELYYLHTSFVGGLSNGSMGGRPDEPVFEFPGFSG